MSSVNEKLAKFKYDCINQAKKDAEDLQLKIKEQIDSQVSEELKEYYEKQEIKFNRSLKNLEKEFHANCYLLETEAKQKVIQRQEEIKKDFKLSLKKKVEDFANGSEYEKYLFKNIDSTMKKINADKTNLNNITLYLTDRDKNKFQDRLSKIYQGIIIEIIDDENIGGCRCFNREANIFIDNTLKLGIEEQVNR